MTEQAQRDEIEGFNIEFAGVLLPSEWPVKYAEVFKKVRKIGNISWEPDELEAPMTNDDALNRRRTKIRALELMREAKIDRKARVNESTLRGNAEPLVFERLKQAVKCRNCSNYLWRSEEAVELTNLVDAERLRRRRSRAIICRCHPDEWTVDNFDDAGETRFFRNYSDEFVHIDVSDGLKRRTKSRHKPDQVWGLHKTKSVGHFRSEFDMRHDKDRIRHSPFAKSDLLYPFLIVEAKREGAGPGFEYAEAQSAFPIRTCLRLQEDLQRVSTQPLTPFLWFLAYQGDEWRVAACVVEGGKYQIYDLWMGRIDSKEGALQLLLIIDHIAEWARRSYRFDILCCLAGGRGVVLGAENMSDTYGSRRSTYSVFESSPFGRLQPSDQGNYQEGEDAVMEDLGAMPQANMSQVRELVGVHHFHRWLQVPPSPRSQAQPYTIRHANMVVFSFSHLSIPPDKRSLQKLLAGISAPDTARIEDTAFLLLSKFRDQREGLVATTRLQIDLLKCEWLRLGPVIINSPATGVRALFSVRTFIRDHDWQIERELLCISCSREAAQELASIAGFRAEALRVSTEWAAEISDFPSSSFDDLRSVTGRLSASAAINSRVLHLIHTSNDNEYRWVPRSEVNELTRSCFLWSYGISNNDVLSVSLDRQENKAMEVLGKPKLPKNIKNLLHATLPLEGSATLLHRVRVERGNVALPIYCLMVFKQIDFYDAGAIKDIIADVRARDICHKVTLGYPVAESKEVFKGRLDTDSHVSMLDRWLGDLGS